MIPGPVLGIAGGIIWAVAGTIRAISKGEKFKLWKFLKAIAIGIVYGWIKGPSAIQDLVQIVGLTAVTDKLIAMLKDQMLGGEE